MKIFNIKNNRNSKYQSIEGLSERARKYMNTLIYPRNMDWRCDREIIVEYFDKQGFPLFEKFIDFQINFSGYTLTIEREERKKDGRHQFDLLLFSRKDIEQKRKIDYFKIGNDWWIDCGQHGSAPFWFSINQKGEIATRDNEIIQIIFSSIENFIEGYAIDNEMPYEHEYYYNCIETSKIQEYMSQNQLNLIKECDDKYNSWYSNGIVTIEYGTRWGSNERYLHLYALSKKDCDLWIEKIKPLLK